MKHSQDSYLQTGHMQSDLKGRTVRGGLVTTAAQALKFSLNFLSTALLARLLVPADFGLFALVTVLTGFLTVLYQMGLSTATIQRPQVTQGQVSTLFWLNVLMGLLTSAAMMSLAPAVALFYNDSRLTGVTLAMACAFVISSLGAQHLALLNRQMLFTSIAVVDLVSITVGVVAGVTMAYLGYGYRSLVSMSLATALSSTALAWILCRWRPSKWENLSAVKSMLWFGGNLTGFNLLGYVTRNVDSLLIGKLFGPVQLGFYAKAYGLLLLPLQQINAPIAAVAVPMLSRLAGEPQRQRAAYLQIAAKVCLIAMPLVAWMIGCADWIILLVLGPQWSQSAVIFACLGASALVQPITNTSGWLFISQDRSHDQLKWGLAGGLLTVLSIAAGLPWGPVGVAASYSVSGLLIRTPLLFWWIGRRGPVRTGDLYRVSLPLLVPALLALGLIVLLRAQVVFAPLPGLALSAALVASVMLLGCWSTPTGRQTLQGVREVVQIALARRPESRNLPALVNNS